MNRAMQTAVMAIAGVVLAGGGFLVGSRVGSAADTANTATKSAPPAGAQVIRGGGQQPVSGHVLAVGNGSITVQVDRAAEGQPRSVIALVSDSSRVVRATTTDLKPSDIKVGDEVTVVGSADSTSGAVTANAVLVGNVPFFFGGAGQGGGGGQSGTRPSGSPRPTSTP